MPRTGAAVRRGIDGWSILIGTGLVLWALAILYPFYNCLVVSLVSEGEYTRTPFMLFPKRIILDSYRYLLNNRGLINGYRSTLFIIAFGVPLNMFLTVTSGYVLSRPAFPGKRVLFFLIVFTMFFSGGLIPTYVTVLRLGLTNTMLRMITWRGSMVERLMKSME